MTISPKSFLYALDAGTGVATITLNRPDKLNALTFEVSRELTDTFRALGGEPGVRAVVITGAGGPSAPAATSRTSSAPSSNATSRASSTFTRDTGALILAMLRCRRPIVGALNGTVALCEDRVGHGTVLHRARRGRYRSGTAVLVPPSYE